jgi:hypothetical protein
LLGLIEMNDNMVGMLVVSTQIIIKNSKKVVERNVFSLVKETRSDSTWVTMQRIVNRN